jgi:hypothetical protein
MDLAKTHWILNRRNRGFFVYLPLVFLFFLDYISTNMALEIPTCSEGNPHVAPLIPFPLLHISNEIVWLIVTLIGIELLAILIGFLKYCDVKLNSSLAKRHPEHINSSEQEGQIIDIGGSILVIISCVGCLFFWSTVVFNNFWCYSFGHVIVNLSSLF